VADEGIHELFSPPEIAIAHAAHLALQAAVRRQRRLALGVPSVRENPHAHAEDAAWPILGIKMQRAPSYGIRS
jgi:hypothetical protein